MAESHPQRNPRDDDAQNVDATALRILNLLFMLNAASEPLSTERIISDQDAGYGSGVRDSDRRKFARDREKLADLGVIVREVRREGAAETEESSWEIDRRKTHADLRALSSDDAEVVIAAIDETFSFQQADPERWPLMRARMKLQAAASGSAPAVHAPHPISPALQTIWQAFAARRAVRITYRDAKGCERVHTIEIRGSFTQGSLTYLACFDRGAGGERTFRTDRIVKAKMMPASDGTYEIPSGFDINARRFLPFDFSSTEPVEASFFFPLSVPSAELDIITRGRGRIGLREDGRIWEVEVRDIQAAARFALAQARRGVRPIGPARLVEAWRSILREAVRS